MLSDWRQKTRSTNVTSMLSSGTDSRSYPSASTDAGAGLEEKMDAEISVKPKNDSENDSDREFDMGCDIGGIEEIEEVEEKMVFSENNNLRWKRRLRRISV